MHCGRWRGAGRTDYSFHVLGSCLVLGVSAFRSFGIFQLTLQSRPLPLHFLHKKMEVQRG